MPQPLAETTDESISVSGGVAAFLPILIVNATGEFEKENLNGTLAGPDDALVVGATVAASFHDVDPDLTLVRWSLA